MRLSIDYNPRNWENSYTKMNQETGNSIFLMLSEIKRNKYNLVSHINMIYNLEKFNRNSIYLLACGFLYTFRI